MSSLTLLLFAFMLDHDTWSKILIGSTTTLSGAIGTLIWKKWQDRKKEALQEAKTYQEGANLTLQIKTNIESLLAANTAKLTGQVRELENTIVSVSVQAAKDKSNYLERITDLEKKMDIHIDRNRDLEDQLMEEIKLRKSCIAQLTDMSKRITELEKNTDKK